MRGGYLKLWRRIRQHPFWVERRRFSRLEAWLDLLLLANFTDSKILRGATWIEVRRGQVFTSQVSLGRRWGWNRKTVSTFLQALKADSMADIETERGGDSGFTRITIVNYERYQGRDAELPDSETDIEPDIGRTLGGHWADISDEGLKKTKKLKKVVSPPSRSNSNPRRVNDKWKRVTQYGEVKL